MGGDYTTGGRAGMRKRIRASHIRLLVSLVGVTLVLAYLFIRPVARLADNPPAEFTNPRPEWDAERKAVEHDLALAYWQRAETALQWNYLYGSELPEQPPPEFKIDTSQFPAMPAAVADSEVRYWRRLRRVWDHRETWETSYEWNTEWVRKVLDAVFR